MDVLQIIPVYVMLRARVCVCYAIFEHIRNQVQYNDSQSAGANEFFFHHHLGVFLRGFNAKHFLFHFCLSLPLSLCVSLFR